MSSTTSPRGVEGSERKPPPDEKRCTATGKDGERCKGYRAKDSELCPGHKQGFGRGGSDPREAAERSAVVRKGAAEARQERAERASRSTKDVLLDLTLRLQEKIEAAYEDALTTGDPEALRRAEAAERLLSRVHGKPKETVEHQGDGETPAQRRLREMSTEELEALVQRRTHLRVAPEH